jgi:hypothetical protein
VASWVTVDLLPVVNGEINGQVVLPAARVWCDADRPDHGELAGEIICEELDAAVARIQRRLAELPAGLSLVR